MLDEGSTNAGSLLRPKRDATPTFVVKVVHFFGDDLGGLPHTQKHAEVLKHWRNDVRKASVFNHIGKHLLKCPPAG